MSENVGLLYIVATPIGNRDDMSFRAIQTLKTVDLIAAEDTRHSLPLLQHFGIATPVISMHAHNEEKRAEKLLDHLQKGQSVALISDAGTPLISDPGFYLVRAVREQGVTVVPIPGPCAAIAALSASGLATDRFLFEGFLPVKTKARLDRLQTLQDTTCTMIFYESPRRILDALGAMQTVFGDDRKVVIAREVTKLFETIRSGTLNELIPWVEQDANQQRGEIVILVSGAAPVAKKNVAAEGLLETLLAELPLKKAVEIVSKMTGERKNELYELALSLKNKL